MTDIKPDLVIGTTAPSFKATSDEALQWLVRANSMARTAMEESGFENVYFFAALETDKRGIAPFAGVCQRLEEIGKSHKRIHTDFWTFQLNDRSTKINPLNRLIRICTGRNLIQEYALRNKKVSHILFLDSDLKVPNDCIPKLLEVKHPIVGGDVPAYCLGGKTLYEYDFPVQEHMNTAGFLLVERDVARRIKWRHDAHDSGNTDDPCYNQDAKDAGFGCTRVRKDVIGVHLPLKPLGSRGHDLEIRQ